MSKSRRRLFLDCLDAYIAICPVAERQGWKQLRSRVARMSAREFVQFESEALARMIVQSENNENDGAIRT